MTALGPSHCFSDNLLTRVIERYLNSAVIVSLFPFRIIFNCLLTVCFFEPVIQISKSRALNHLLIILLVVSYLLFDLLIRLVILTV